MSGTILGHRPGHHLLARHRVRRPGLDRGDRAAGIPAAFPALGLGGARARGHLDSDVATCREALAKAGHRRAADIAAIGITNQRETTVVWDRATGKPIHRAIVWQDRRTAEVCARLKADGPRAAWSPRKTGLLLDPYFSGTKIAWILDHVPGARERAPSAANSLFGTVDSFLLWRLTGGKVHATDATNASRTLLFDIHTGAGTTNCCACSACRASMLPRGEATAPPTSATPTAELFGAAIPIRGIAGDQQAATIGQACFAPGMMKSTYGTGCFALLNTGADAGALEATGC